MADLIYSVITSLDGYISDKEGNFDWAEPDEEVHSFVNQLERPVGTYLYGRRMYETMAVWETLQTHDQPAFIAEFADIWRAADKVVYSSTLGSASTPRTRLESKFEPEAVRRLKESSPRDITIAGPTLAAHAFRAGLVDVCQLLIAPVLVGDGKNAFPGGVRLNLTLHDERRFANGMVFLHYRTAKRQAA
jgi:dihydrofolate reductase